MLPSYRGGCCPCIPAWSSRVILALVGNTRNILFAGKVGVVAGIAAMLRCQRLAARHPRRSPASAGGAGFGSLPMNSENMRRSSSESAFAISFIGSNTRSFSRNMNSWISA